MNICSIGWCSFPITTFWFYLAFTKHERLLGNRFFIAFCILLAAFFISQQWTGHLIIDFVKQPYGWGTVWSSSPVTLIFSAYYFVLVIGMIYLAFNFGRKSKDLQVKKQARLLWITPAICLPLGATTDTILPELGIRLVPPIAIIFILLWGGGLVYAITRYGLMTFTPAVAADEILTTMGDSLLLVSLDGKIVSTNRAASEMLEYAVEELVNRKFSSIIATKEANGNTLLQEALERGRINSRAVTYLTKDGKAIPVLLSASVVKDKEGEPVGVVVTAHDMTEQRKMELDLRQSEERYRTLVDYALVGVFVHQKNRIVFSNQRFASLLAYKQEEVIGLSIDELIHPEERDLVMARARRRQEGVDESIIYEIRLLKKGGGTLYALISNAIIEYQGEVATLVTVTDITDTKTRVALEQANKELEAFSYSVSHDLRAPLRSIDGFSEALLEDYADKLDEMGRDYLHRVRAASQHMAQLIDDLLKLSHLTQAEMRYERVDLSAIVRGIAVGFKEKEPEREVKFVIAEGVAVNGDASLLRIALENLLGNAWKFTKEHPYATIEFGVSQHEGQTVYFVRDDGAGFDMSYAGRLFTPFQRLHSSSEFEGTGIGLAIVQRIIRRHRGSVWAEGEVGKGAIFYFTLQSREGQGVHQ